MLSYIILTVKRCLLSWNTLDENIHKTVWCDVLQLNLINSISAASFMFNHLSLGANSTALQNVFIIWQRRLNNCVGSDSLSESLTPRIFYESSCAAALLSQTSLCWLPRCRWWRCVTRVMCWPRPCGACASCRSCGCCAWTGGEEPGNCWAPPSTHTAR